MFIDQNELLQATNGGLEIILSYYPQAREAAETDKKEFKIRNERTASASLKKMADGNWVCTDFGDDQVPRNGIQVCMKEEGISYREALVLLGAKSGIGGIKPEINKPGFETRDAEKKEKEGEYYFDIKDEISETELKVLGEKVNAAVCRKYNVYALNSFTQIKNRKALITSSNENYPIFLIDNDKWKKIYQPFNYDKQFRFRYYGEKPKDYINGLDQVKKAYEKLQEIAPEDQEGKPKEIKLDQVILCSGERDALNCAGFGYEVIWLNSETAKLSPGQYKEIMAFTNRLYNIPDLDVTGIKAGYSLGIEYLDIYTVQLPARLKRYQDHRGHSRKDFCDYVQLWPKNEDFNRLLRNALPMRFWDEYNSDTGLKYEFNNVQAYYFLFANGFTRLKDNNAKEGFIFVRNLENIVTEIKTHEIRDFLSAFLEEKQLPVGLRNMIHRTRQLSDGSLAKLPMAEYDFTDYTETEQYLFFRNKTWKVDKIDIHEYKPGEIGKCIWADEIIQHKVKRTDPPFRIFWNEKEAEYDIEVLNTDSLFLCFLVNTCRIHWRKELEFYLNGKDDEYKQRYRKDHLFDIDGPLLSNEEKYEQKQHLLNKIFSIGYLLHRYKDPSRPWCVFAMDSKESDIGESHGRSGKSVCYKAIEIFMKSVYLSGRNPKLTENPHIYDRVTLHTDYILIDDSAQFLDFEFFFDAITGKMVVNPKNNKSYEIPFKDVPKIAITTNYTPRNINPSTEARILYTVFSDYYHERGQENWDEYEETRTIRDDIGKNLFYDDYTEENWNADFNFFARCLQFFLSVPSPRKVTPPLDNVNRRNLRTVMGQSFFEWANVYFAPQSERLNDYVLKKDAFESYKAESGLKNETPHRFIKRLRAFCHYYGYTLNPPDLTNSQGRIISKQDGDSVEKIYILSKSLEDLKKTDTELPFKR